MIIIPLYFILFIFIGYTIILGGFYLINFLHIVKGGAINFISLLFTLFIGFCVISILYFAAYLLKDVDWKTPVTIWDNQWVSNSIYLNL